MPEVTAMTNICNHHKSKSVMDTSFENTKKNPDPDKVNKVK